MSEACFDRAEHDLVELVRVGQQLVVVDLHQERDLVRVLARDRAQHAEGGRDRVAAAFDGELDDVLRVEVIRVLGEAGAAGVLDALVDRQDRQIAGAAEAAVAEHALEVAEHAVVAVRNGEDAVDEVAAREGAAVPSRFWGF